MDPRLPQRRLTRTFPRLGSLLCLALVTAFVLSACGGDDDDTGAATATAPAATATTAGATATTPAEAPTNTTAPEPSTATTVATTAPEATATSAPTEPAATPTEEATLTLSVYFLRDEKIATAHRVVPHTLEVAAAAMDALLAGPTDAEVAAGLSSAVPAGTEVLGISIENGVANIDLSSEFESGGGSLSMRARLAQVVYTLTQFPTVQTVTFSLDGEPVDVFGGEGILLENPVGRADFEDITPAIFVEAPAVDDVVSSPIRIWGTANTFEATFMITLRGPNDEILYEEHATATSGTGTRGTFDVTVTLDSLPAGDGTLIVWEASAKDGQPVNVVEIPVTFGE